MSIIIKGINKPKNCISCLFCSIGFNGNFCIIKNEHIDNPSAISTWCPIAEPKPHEKMIDAYELMAELGIIKSFDCTKCGWGNKTGFCTRDKDFVDTCAVIEDMINEAAMEEEENERVG